jgi:hypothetical protein
MHFETVKEAFHNNNTFAVMKSAVKIKEDQRLAKAGRKPILWFGLVQGSAGVSDQNSIFIVNGDHDPTLHAALARKNSRPEEPCCFGSDPTLGKVGVTRIDAGEHEGKGPVRFLLAW